MEVSTQPLAKSTEVSYGADALLLHMLLTDSVSMKNEESVSLEVEDGVIIKCYYLNLPRERCIEIQYNIIPHLYCINTFIDP